ncbi:MAG: hypothetical protein ABI353_00235, partial [Isosphaeraceae bacterium]
DIPDGEFPLGLAGGFACQLKAWSETKTGRKFAQTRAPGGSESVERFIMVCRPSISNREPIDAEIAEEICFNRLATLDRSVDEAPL